MQIKDNSKPFRRINPGEWIISDNPNPVCFEVRRDNLAVLFTRIGSSEYALAHLNAATYSQIIKEDFFFPVMMTLAPIRYVGELEVVFISAAQCASVVSDMKFNLAVRVISELKAPFHDVHLSTLPVEENHVVTFRSKITAPIGVTVREDQPIYLKNRMIGLQRNFLKY